MALLLEACPSFADKWVQHRAIYGEEHELYIDLMEFAHHVVSLQTLGQKEELIAVFIAVERLRMTGDEYVREAATIGLLEGIQNIAGNQGIDPEVFVGYLKPESARWWKKLNEFWGDTLKA